MPRLLQINPVLRTSTSTGRIMQEIGDCAMAAGWDSYVAYSRGRDGVRPCTSHIVPVGNKLDVAIHGLQTRFLDRHGLGSTSATRAFVHRLEQLKPDIVHIHNIHGYFLNYPILFRYLRESGVPVVWTVHDCWLYTGHCYYYTYAGCNRWQTGCHNCPQRTLFPKSWMMDRSHRNYADKRRAFTSLPPEQLTIVPVSEWMEGELRKSFFKDYPMRVIHNGIDLSTFRPQPTDDVVQRYGLEGRSVVLGLASIWCKEKGWDDLMALSRKLQRDEVLVMVGVTPAQQRLLPEGVVGIRRTENVAQLAALYAAATAFVNPTWQDNYPTVNLEAIACGTPVVTYRTGGSIESITPATGRVVEQGDVDGLLRAVREIRSLGADHFRQPCRQFAEANFEKTERYADYIKLYQEIMDQHKA